MALRRYFTTLSSDPAPLLATCQRQVRFEEIDLMQILWHGRYASYFEDGREAFGKQYGLSYEFFMKKRIMAPLTQLHVDFKMPLKFSDCVTIETRLHFNEAMRLDFSYRIILTDRDETQLSDSITIPHIMATGYTVQMLVDESGASILKPPAWMTALRKAWQEGDIEQMRNGASSKKDLE